MKVKYICTTWGMDHLSLEVLLKRIREAGYDGVEMGVPEEKEGRRRLRSLLDDNALELVAQQWTAGATAEEHAASFEQQYRRALEMEPLLVNSHTGKDYYSTEENVLIMRKAQELEEDGKVLITHETHRGRATFSVGATLALFHALPELRLTADFSHWCCVHESFLENQAAAMDSAIGHSRHIHARVGHPEGPQVSDPGLPEWAEALESHLAWWQKIADRRNSEGVPYLTICPEFGPPGYMMTIPFTRQPVADLWQINLFMKDFLQHRLKT